MYLLYRYYTFNVIYQYIILTESPDFVKQVQPAIALNITEQSAVNEDLPIIELDTDVISEIEIVRGESQQLKEQVWKLLYALLSILGNTKSMIDLNYDEIMEKVLRSKEKEKDLITGFLKDLTDEERELEDLFKNNKLERWSKGLQKGVTQYVKDTYDEERDAMDAQIILERQAGENNMVSNMNLNIYSLDIESEHLVAQQIEKEEYSMSGLPDDDDYGDRDGDEDY